MKYKKLIQGALMLGGFALSASSLAATPSAEMLANTCAGCHGPGGSSHGPATPGIAGIYAEYFMDAMSAYKSGDRKGTVMNRIAKGYTDEEIELMAKYFAGRKFVGLKQDTDKSKVRLGKQLHDRACEKCHEDGGKVAEDSAILAGQPKPYLLWSLEDFTSGKREMPKKMKRRVDEVVKAKGDEGLEALAEFYASQAN